MLGVTSKPAQAKIVDTLAQYGMRGASHLATHFKKYTAVFAAIGLVTYLFSKNLDEDGNAIEKTRKVTTKVAEDGTLVKSHKATATNLTVHCFDPAEPAVNINSGKLTNNALYVGQKINGQFTNEELEANYTVANQVSTNDGPKFVYFDTDQNKIVFAQNKVEDADLDNANLVRVYLRDDNLAAGFDANKKHHFSNFIYEGLERNHQHQDANNHVEMTTKNWTEAMVQKYKTVSKHEEKYRPSWSTWKVNPDSKMKAFAKFLGTWTEYGFWYFRKPLYAISSFGLMATVGSKVLIKKA